MIKYWCESQQRVLGLIKKLVIEHETHELPIATIVKKTGYDMTTTYRDLKNLQIAGFVVQLKNGSWSLSDNIIQTFGQTKHGDSK